MAMIIATRTLKLLTQTGSIDVPIRIFAPEPARIDWACRFEIDWPEGRLERFAEGVDAVQALLLALQMIGAQLYASSQHESGRLMWLEPARGYGFPVPQSMRDMLIGDDLRYGA